MIYKSPPINGDVIIETKTPFISEGRTLIERLENKIKEDNEILKKLEEEIAEKRKNLSNIEDYVKKEAQEKAKSILEEAFKKQEEAKERGYNEGLSQGIKEGKRKAEIEITRITASMNAVLSSFNSLYEEALKKADENIVLELAFLIAKKIIKDELSVKREIVLKNINSALQKAGQSKIKLLLNPEDVEIAKEFLKDVDIILDSSISPGGCKVYFDFGVIDAEIKNQLNAIKEEIG